MLRTMVSKQNQKKMLHYFRFFELRNSYQNRPNIGTALLWAVGLGGKKDLQTGLKGTSPNNLIEEF
jgi:hypothetical protein